MLLSTGIAPRPSGRDESGTIFCVMHRNPFSGVTAQTQPHKGAALAIPNSSSLTDFLPPITSRGDYSSAAVDYFCQNLDQTLVREFKAALSLKVLD